MCYGVSRDLTELDDVQCGPVWLKLYRAAIWSLELQLTRPRPSHEQRNRRTQCNHIATKCSDLISEWVLRLHMPREVVVVACLGTASVALTH